jgi:hypothetical protein
VPSSTLISAPGHIASYEENTLQIKENSREEPSAEKLQAVSAPMQEVWAIEFEKEVAM